MLIFKINKKSNLAWGFSLLSRQVETCWHLSLIWGSAESPVRRLSTLWFSICAGLREWGGWCAESKNERQAVQSSQQCLDFDCGLASTRSTCASMILTLFHHSFTLHDVCASLLFWIRTWGSWRPCMASPQISRRPWPRAGATWRVLLWLSCV